MSPDTILTNVTQYLVFTKTAHEMKIIPDGALKIWSFSFLTFEGWKFSETPICTVKSADDSSSFWVRPYGICVSFPMIFYFVLKVNTCVQAVRIFSFQTSVNNFPITLGSTLSISLWRPFLSGNLFLRVLTQFSISSYSSAGTTKLESWSFLDFGRAPRPWRPWNILDFLVNRYLTRRSFSALSFCCFFTAFAIFPFDPSMILSSVLFANCLLRCLFSFWKLPIII